MNDWQDRVCCCVCSQLFIMAYHAGIQEEPSALVDSIGSNIQKLTLLSNSYTHTNKQTNTHIEEFISSSCKNEITPALLTPVGESWWKHEDTLALLINVCALSSSPASALQRAVNQLGTEQDSSQLRQTLWVMGAELALQKCFIVVKVSVQMQVEKKFNVSIMHLLVKCAQFLKYTEPLILHFKSTSKFKLVLLLHTRLLMSFCIMKKKLYNFYKK